MESENLKRLFLWDLHSNVKIRFSWLTLYGFAVAGLAYTFLFQPWLFFSVLGQWSVPLVHFELIWIAFGTVGALLAFRKLHRC